MKTENISSSTLVSNKGDYGLRSKFSSYTPLNTSREKILKECKHWFKEDDIINPYPIKESSRTNKSKYFHFHKSHGHNTNNCIHLKDSIKELINKEWLTEHTWDDDWKGSRENKKGCRSLKDTPKNKCPHPPPPVEKNPPRRNLKFSLEPKKGKTTTIKKMKTRKGSANILHPLLVVFQEQGTSSRGQWR